MAMNGETLRGIFGNPLPRLKEHHFRTAFLALVITLASITMLSVIFKRGIYVNLYLFIIFILFLFVSFRERKQVHLRWETLIFVAFLAALDFLGGVYAINGVYLYDYWFGFIRYDQIVHAMCFAIVAFALYDFVMPYLKPLKSKYRLAIILLATLGVGAVFEIMEFAAALIFNVDVGDYFNNAADLVYDLIGAVLGTLVAYFIHRKKGG